MRTMNTIMNDATNENIALARKRSIIYGILCAATLFVLWIPTLILISLFPEMGSIIGFSYGVILVAGFLTTMILSFNYSQTYDHLKRRKQMDLIHQQEMAWIQDAIVKL